MTAIFKFRNFVKGFVLVGAAIFTSMQFIPAKRNISSTSSEADISRAVEVPPKVDKLLRNSCYDCHSNNTRYPWYSRIQPAAYFMERHIIDGKKELNFSEFGNYSRRRQRNKLRSIASQVRSEEMPLPSYTWIHWSAKLSDREKKLVEDWATRLENEPVE